MTVEDSWYCFTQEKKNLLYPSLQTFPSWAPSIQTLLEVYTLYFASPFDTVSYCTGRTQQMTEHKPELTAGVDTATGELWEFHLHKSQAGGCVPFLFFSVMGWERKGSQRASHLKVYLCHVICHMAWIIAEKHIVSLTGRVMLSNIVQTAGVNSSFVYVERWELKKHTSSQRGANITYYFHCIQVEYGIMKCSFSIGK